MTGATRLEKSYARRGSNALLGQEMSLAMRCASESELTVQYTAERTLDVA